MRIGNIFDSKAQVWVCPVNTKGVMGAGIAKKFANQFPSVLHHYRKACLSKKILQPGGILPIKQQDVPPPPTWIVCLATKDHWKYPSRIQWIHDGLDSLTAWCENENITSLAIPAIGCGLGQLSWNLVQPLIKEKLHSIPNLEVYDP